MKQYRITLRTRANDEPGTIFAIVRQLTTDVPNSMSPRAVLEAAATAMGLNLDPETFRRTRLSRYAGADVAGSGGRSHLTAERCEPNGRAS